MPPELQHNSLYTTKQSNADTAYGFRSLSKGFQQRLVVGLALLALLVLLTIFRGNGSVSGMPVYFRYGLPGLVPLVFLYCCYPLMQRGLAELREKRVGFTSIMTLTIFILNGYCTRVFLETGELASMIEFSVFVIILVFGGSVMQIGQKRNNDIVAHQQKRIDNILASIDEMLWSIDADTQAIRYVNGACYSVLGYTPHELMTNKDVFYDSIHPDDRQAFYHAIHGAIATGSSFVDFRVFRKDGTIGYLRGEGKFQPGDDDEPGIINGIAKDITKQRLAEFDANKKAQEVENILGSINDAFFAINRDYVIIFVNNEFRRLYKNEYKVLVGAAYKDIAPVELHRSFYKYCDKAMDGGIGVSFEEFDTLLKKWFYYKIYPTENGAAVYITDITDQKELLQQVLTEKAKLDGQNEKLAQIAWLQSHKVRSQIANIIGLIPLLDYNNPLCNDNINILKGVKEAAEKLDDVVQEISDKANSASVLDTYQKQYQHMRVK